MEKQWVIVGLDPGTTAGYAVLDINGKLLKVDSSKDFDLSKIISNIIEFGKVIVTGTDKQRVPSFVEQFAAKTGSKIISPNEDLSVALKSELTRTFECQKPPIADGWHEFSISKLNPVVFEHTGIPLNHYSKNSGIPLFKGDHQQDALASAVLAYRKISHTLKKIDEFLETNKKQNLKNKIIELVIKHDGFSIRSALELIEKPTETNQIIKKIIETKELKESDFFKLHERLKSLEDENKILKMHNSKLRNDINKLSNNKPKEKISFDEKSKKLLSQKENRLNFLYSSIEKKDEDIKKTNEELKKLTRFLACINEKVLLKKLNNLGSVEFDSKKSILNIKEGDVLLVNNPNIVSQSAYESIKDKINIIIFKEKPSKKIKDDFNFIFIEANKLNMEEDYYFALVDRKEFEKIIEKDDILKKILREYKSDA
jgi:predicted RNase H-like nuclease (RuvC/YqgF family)